MERLKDTPWVTQLTEKPVTPETAALALMATLETLTGDGYKYDKVEGAYTKLINKPGTTIWIQKRVKAIGTIEVTI